MPLNPLTLSDPILSFKPQGPVPPHLSSMIFSRTASAPGLARPPHCAPGLPRPPHFHVPSPWETHVRCTGPATESLETFWHVLYVVLGTS